MNDKNIKIHICFSTDENYVPHTAACICSIAAHHKTLTPINIVILDCGIQQETKSQLIKLCKNINFSIEFININIMDLKASSWTDSWSVATFARLYISKLVDLDRIIYLDCDTTVHTDIEELWKTDLEGKSLAAVLDCGIVPGVLPDVKRVGSYPNKFINIGFFSGTWKEYFRNYLKLSKTSYENYFNAGILVMDLKKIRDNQSDIRCIKRLNKSYAYLDQCILNFVYAGDVKYLNFKWNCFNIPFQKFIHLSDKQKHQYKMAQKNPGIIHYVKKPFRNRYAMWSGLYWKYLRQTPWYSKIRKKYIILATAVGFVKFIKIYPLLFRISKALNSLFGLKIKFI